MQKYLKATHIKGERYGIDLVMRTEFGFPPINISSMWRKGVLAQRMYPNKSWAEQIDRYTEKDVSKQYKILVNEICHDLYQKWKCEHSILWAVRIYTIWKQLIGVYICHHSSIN